MHLTKTTKKMMTMIFKANYSRAERAAYELLRISNSQELPVKVKKLSKLFPNLKIKTYSWFGKKRGMTYEEVCDFANSNEGCCYYEKLKDRYLILYNETVENKGRIRWTIAHELGHFMLKHNEVSNRSVVGRSNLSNEEYDVYEKEANCFARTLLAPPTVIVNLGRITVEDISYLCEVSFNAASNIISFLNTGQQKGYGYSFNSNVRRMFNDYIFKIKNKHFCSDCRHEFVAFEPSFCPICSRKHIFHTFYSFGGNKMKYDGYELDDFGRAIECPRCGNEELHYEGDHCKVCGLFIINKCTNQHIWNNEVEWECGTILDGNARYCTKCGHKSTFSEQDLLDEWDKEKRAKELALEPLPF